MSLVIQRLYIQNAPEVDDMVVEFTNQFNVITGESGSGKSTIMKAIGILLDVIKPPQTKEIMTITALFSIDRDHPFVKALDEFGIFLKEEEFILRKTVGGPKKRNIAYFNDMPVTKKILKTLSAYVEIISQHQSLKLLQPETQRLILDEFALDKNELENIKKNYRELKQTSSKWEITYNSHLQKLQQVSFWKYQKEKIEKLNPSLEDYNDLKLKNDALSILLKEREKFSEIYQVIESQGAQIFYNQLTKNLKNKERFPKELELSIQGIKEHWENLSFHVSKFLEKSDFNTQELEDVQNKISDYQKMIRLFHLNSVEELVEKASEYEESINTLEIEKIWLQETLLTMLQGIKKLTKSFEELNEKREKKIPILQDLLEKELKFLEMRKAKILITLEPKKQAIQEVTIPFAEFKEWDKVREFFTSFTEHGNKTVQFFFSSSENSVVPINQVASGGEISRVMLALRSILSENKHLLLFDEIDQGISGKIAEKVGQKLKQLGEHSQIISISHLPQVVSQANSHLCVKAPTGKKQIIKPLDKESRVHEIAILISGKEVKDSSKLHALELMQ